MLDAVTGSIGQRKRHSHIEIFDLEYVPAVVFLNDVGRNVTVLGFYKVGITVRWFGDMRIC